TRSGGSADRPMPTTDDRPNGRGPKDRSTDGGRGGPRDDRCMLPNPTPFLPTAVVHARPTALLVPGRWCRTRWHRSGGASRPAPTRQVTGPDRGAAGARPGGPVGAPHHGSVAADDPAAPSSTRLDRRTQLTPPTRLTQLARLTRLA